MLLLDRRGEFLSELSDPRVEGFGYWRIRSLPPRVAAATLAIEDHRFYWHPGVDPLAILRAVWQNFRSGRRISGASTIAMQLARLQRPAQRTLPNKLMEAARALLMVLRYGREAVLAQYLRLAPYGNQIYGIAYAARRYLAKPVEDLSWAEVAYLVALPQAPGLMNPFSARGHALALLRARRILGLLRDREELDLVEFSAATRELGQFQMPRRKRRPKEALHAILELERLAREPARAALLQGHPLIRTSLDLGLQRRVARLVGRNVRRYSNRGVGNGACIVVKAGTNEILAWVGSTGYFNEKRAGSIDYILRLRSPGSTLKPFVYAAALELGTITPATVLEDLRRPRGGFGNADGIFLGPLLPRIALANSRNIPATNLLRKTGLETVYSFMQRLGLHKDEQPATRFGLTLALGGMPVTLEHLVEAYTVLSNDGLHQPLRWLKKEPFIAKERVFSRATARQILLFLSDPVARLPSFPRMGNSEYPFPVAVKTGTSSGFRDVWTVASSRRATVGVWMGHPDATPMSALGGYEAAAPLAHKILLLLHQDQTAGLQDLPFPAPEGFVRQPICVMSGKLATPACHRIIQEYFSPGQAPKSSCRTHLRIAIDTRNGLMASDRTPAPFVEVRTFVKPLPRYSAWSVAQKLQLPPAGVSPLGADEPENPKTASEPALHPAVSSFSPPSRPPGDAGPPSPWRPAGKPTIEILSPKEGMRILLDPETPRQLATLKLEAAVSPSVPQIVWYVDGEPYRLADYPYTIRWPLKSGRHRFEARLPATDSISKVVRVEIE